MYFTLLNINYYHYLLLSLLGQAEIKGIITQGGGVRRRGKTGRYGKVGVKRKRWILAIPSKETRGSHPGWNHGNRPPEVEENPGSMYCQMLRRQARPLAHSRYIRGKQEENNTRAAPLTPQEVNPDSPQHIYIYIYIYIYTHI